MIRHRTLKGQVIPLPAEVKFVEITDLEGRLAAVTYLGNDGSIHLYTADDVEFAKYCKLMKIDNPVKVLAVEGN